MTCMREELVSFEEDVLFPDWIEGSSSLDAWEGQVDDLLKDVEVWETKLELSTLEQFEVPCLWEQMEERCKDFDRSSQERRHQ